MKERWAKPRYERHQLALMSPSVDDMLPQEHSIRFFECLLEGLEWREWEIQYK